MANTFRKYEFTLAAWATLRKKIEQTTTTPEGESVTTWKDCAVHEIGYICLQWGEDAEGMPVCDLLSDKWAVDILFYSEPPADFAAYEVWPEPCGVHTFAGCEGEYLKGYCAKFPDSPFCLIPNPVINGEG